MNTQLATNGKNLSFLAGSQAPTAYTDIRVGIHPMKNGNTYLKSENTNFDDLEPLARPIPASREVYSDGAGI